MIPKDVTHGRGYIYALQYHIVWVTKYRKSIFIGDIEKEVENYLLEILQSLDMIPIVMEIMPDHIHLFVDCKPQLRLSDAIKIRKGNTARWLFLAHPELKQQLWDGHLWNPSYFVATVSDRTLEIIKKPCNFGKETHEMQIYSTYSVKMKEYTHIFADTISVYREAVDFLIEVCRKEWDTLSSMNGTLLQQQYVERLCHKTKNNPEATYGSFDKKFYKFPSYLRRGAIQEAIGKVSSYQSNLKNWEATEKAKRGKKPSPPKAGCVYPCMYRTVMYEQTDTYEAKLKVFLRNTWDWITVQLRKSDIDYIEQHCTDRKKCAPTLQKRGREWYLDFPFEENVTLNTTAIWKQIVLGVDLGINSVATVSVMQADGTVIGRHFLKLPKEYDCLKHAINRIKKAQQNGNTKTPRLWAKVKGINDDIAVKTANFIMDIAKQYHADVIVFEHLDKRGKKRGSKKQTLHLWKSQYVQSMVEQKAHRLGMRIRHVCAWGTSQLAFDGSGRVLRGKDGGCSSYSVCKFQNGKTYNCDLSASYNIGSRYFVQEIVKSLPERERFVIVAKVPQCTKRSTCTLSTLINLNAELISLRA